MAKKAYIGVDGVARKVKKGYLGILTGIPIYEEQNATVNITADNISDLFDVANGSYYFTGPGDAFTTNNGGVNSSTATTTLTAKKDMTVSFNYSYSSEANYDKFTLKVAGITVENAVSGATTSKSYSGSLTAGQTIEFTYAKDSSQSSNDDKCTFSGMVVTAMMKTQTGVETKSVARKVKKSYVGIGGVARQFFTGGKSLSEFAEGDIVYVNENGSPVPFYLAKHNYESDLNGAGRTLLVRKDCYDTHTWNSSIGNDWASCTLLSWLNGDYLNLLDEDIRGVIGATKYYYTISDYTKSVITRSDAVFQLSVAELGKKATYANAEGTALPISETLQIAYIDGYKTAQWTRSIYLDGSNDACYLDSMGVVLRDTCTHVFGSRPAFTLPADSQVNEDTLVIFG